VDLERLQSWMMPNERPFRRDRERLRVALLDLRDFLRVSRGRPKLTVTAEPAQGNWFELEHEEFRRFLETHADWREAVAEQHSRIAGIGQVELKRRDYLDRDAAAYYARYLVEHLRWGSDPAARWRAMEDPNFHQRLVELAVGLLERHRYALAAEVVGNAIQCVRHCLVVRDDSDMLRRLGDLQARRAFLLHKDHRNLEALQSLDEAMATWRRPEWLASVDVMDEIGAIHALRGVTLNKLERNEEALRELDESIRIRGALPRTPATEQALAVAHANRSLVLEAEGRLGEAEVGWRKAISHYEATRSEDTRTLDARCNCWRQLAAVLKRRGKIKQADAALEKAERLLDEAEDLSRADVLLERGEIDAGLDVLRREVMERRQWQEAPRLARTLLAAATEFNQAGHPKRAEALAAEVAELLRIPDLPVPTYAYAAGLSTLHYWISIIPGYEEHRRSAEEWAARLDGGGAEVRAWQEFLGGQPMGGRFPMSRGDDRVPLLITPDQLLSGEFDLIPSNDVARVHRDEFRKK
jgi:tetratricopeptide (TPR) repeat protein